MPAIETPLIELNDGTKIPQLGFGAYKVKAGEAERVAAEALEVGYRHIDTATLYENEREIGRAIQASGIPREELFITTKLWNTDQPDPHAAFEKSLQQLGLDYVDLYLIHWPQPMFGEAVGAWRSLVEILGSGKAASIGVSNFEIPHLQQLIDETGVVPSVNQIELHPLHQRRELVTYCQQHGIAIEAWAPLARGNTELFESPEVVSAAEAHGKTPAQIIIRWHLEQGRIVFPKSRNRARMVENANVYGFELSADELAAIDGLNEDRALGPDPFTFDRR
ncbi:MAG: aldo/keto reductase [Leucobacter sp.]